MFPFLKCFINFLSTCFLILLPGLSLLSAQSRIKSVPVAHVPEKSEDAFGQRITQKTLLVGNGNFILLTRRSEQEYALESFTSDLKKIWQTAIPLTSGEALEAFSHNEQHALLLTYQKAAGNGNQAVQAYLFDLKTGQKKESTTLLEAPSGARRVHVTVSDDGTKLVAYQNIYQLDQLKSIRAQIYDGNLLKLKDRTYDLSDLKGIVSATVRIANTGEQYVALVINNATKLTVRRYNNTNTKLTGMDVQVGGIFEGQSVYVLDTKFQLEQDGNLYAAVICANEKSGNYHSVKLVRFDFGAGTMKYAPEYKFTPQYLAALNKAPGNIQVVKRLEDIYLSDLLVGPEKNMVLVAEKKYHEGPKLPFAAKEMHYFAYDEYLNPTWNAIIHKNQSAPVTDGFTSISYKAYLNNDKLHVLTLETQEGKTDLFHRKIDIKTGATETPKPLGLNLITSQGITYVKNFTVWLDDKNIITVATPAKKTSLQLNKITVK